ncbi:hypothetical protein [Dietzia sp. 179-F 9C3 NHS]|uniref:hypothetical protein n=1 Tax=Dietzia sp. 179-F 9C3 NHS TaxID=3374295 RepID=UPI00387991F8
MVVLWFVLALVLLAAALVLLSLDAKQRNRRSGGGEGAEPASAPAVGSAEGPGGEGDDEVDAADPEPDTGAPVAPGLATPPSGAAEDGRRAEPEQPLVEPGQPRPAPFQRGAAGRPQSDAGQSDAGESRPGGDEPVSDGDEPRSDGDEPISDGEEPPRLDPTVAAMAGAAGAAGAGAAAASSPRLLDRVRGILPRRRGNAAPAEPTGAPTEHAEQDPLADSPVVRWLEEREFEPTPTPAPDFRHGDFAGGLPKLGTVSHGMFRGRRAIMGVSGGRAVLALRRDTASDVVLDLSRPDVDAEPGFHDAGEVAALEARTSDVGRLDLVDRERLADALRGLPADVRRVWAEGEWVAATVDDAENPATWDDAVVALHGAADVLAPLPPIGGRARPLPADIDPGAPGAADGPDADPAVGMDGTAGTGVAAGGGPGRDGDTPATAVTATMVAVGTADAADDEAGAVETAPVSADTGSRRAGHLRLVPGRREGVRDLTDAPVVADRGEADADPDAAEPAAGAAEAPGSSGEPGQQPEAEPEVAEPDAEPEVEEPDPFAEIMEPGGAVEDRGDVASDHLAPRPPLSRPSRGAGQAFPEDASVPPLAAGAASGAAGIKPLGSEDDEDEIRTEVERFDAARTDGGTDLDGDSSGRHGSDGITRDAPGEETAALSVAELAAKLGVNPDQGGRRRRRRRAEDGPDTDEPGATEPTIERAGGDPDLEETRSLRLPPHLRED